jgi:hypothetical protein
MRNIVGKDCFGEGAMKCQNLLRATLVLSIAIAAPSILFAQPPRKEAMLPSASNFAQPPIQFQLPPELIQPPVYHFEIPTPPPSLTSRFIAFLSGQSIWTWYLLAALIVVIFAKKGPAIDKVYTPNPSPALPEPPGETPSGVNSDSDVPPASAALDHLTEAELIDKLGAPLCVFVPSRAYKIAGFIAFFLLGSVGLAGTVGIVAHACSREWNPPVTGAIITLSIGLIFAIAMVLGAVIGFRNTKRTFPPPIRILACPQGIIHINGGKVFASYWDQIKEARLWEKETYMGHHPLTGAMNSYTQILTITRNDGGTIDISQNQLTRLPELTEFIVSNMRLKPDTAHF